jgi:hypothetical protein
VEVYAEYQKAMMLANRAAKPAWGVAGEYQKAADLANGLTPAQQQQLAQLWQALQQGKWTPKGTLTGLVDEASTPSRFWYGPGGPDWYRQQRQRLFGEDPYAAYMRAWALAEDANLIDGNRGRINRPLSDSEIYELSELLQQEVKYQVFQEINGTDRIYILSKGRWSDEKNRHMVTGARTPKGYKLIASAHTHPVDFLRPNIGGSAEDQANATARQLSERIISRNAETGAIVTGIVQPKQ